jgi:tetratricopeptide (TPR) repeat protein
MKQQVKKAGGDGRGGGSVQALEKRRRGFSQPWKNLIGLLWLLPLATWGDPEYSRTAEDQEKPTVEMVADEKEILRQQVEEVQASQRKELAVAMADYRGGRYAEASAQLEKLIQDDPTLLTAWNILGYVYLKANRWDDAIKLWNNLRAIRPDFFPVYNWLGRAYMLRNQVIPATEMYRSSLKLRPRQEREATELNLARLLRWGGNLEEACQILRPLHRAYPQRRDITRELASALISNRNFEEALPLWTELRSGEPSNRLFRAKEAVALLHTGHTAEAVDQARGVLAEDAQQPDALLLMANYAQFCGGKPEEALPWLQRLMAAAPSFDLKRSYALRFVMLYGQLFDRHPERFPLEIPAAVLKPICEADPYNVDVTMLYAEQLMSLQRHAEAREQMARVRDHLNPNSIRMHRAEFEMATVEGRFDEALAAYQELAAFNPQDPFLHYLMARWYAAQNRYSSAYQELDQLESAGRRGAVAVLLYHGLSTSESGEILPATKLREHLLALKGAGFRFIGAHELPDYFAKRARLADGGGAIELERVACVTFDDARRDSMRYGTPVGKELRIPFSMHIPVGFIEKQHPFMCTWEQLRDYQKAGCWIYGGHTFYAHERVPIDAEKRLGFALPNHLWREPDQRLESDEEYDARLTHEYVACRDLIVQNLGRSNECNFFAYPFGDIGQITRSNDRAALRKNLEHVARAFAVGFIQTYFGYAVAGDNPLLYQRYEPDRYSTGEEVVMRVLEQHPVNVARKLRAEFAALQGKRYLVLGSLRALQQDGYPVPALEMLCTSVGTKLGRRISLADIERARPTPPVSVAPEPPVVPALPSAVVTPKPTPAPATNGTPVRAVREAADAGGARRDLHDPLR